MDIKQFVRLAMEEDVRDGDHTSLACIPSSAKGKMKMLAKDEGILAGMDVAEAIFKEIDKDTEVKTLVKDGETMKHGLIVIEVSGSVHSLLKSERLVLNTVQRMSGIATNAHRLASLISDTKTKVLDTRKTTPNFRWFEKEAVRIGGGTNHRMGLYDAMMIKDNHIDFAGGITSAITKSIAYQKEKGMNIDIIVEARNMEEIEEILSVGGIRRILIDNFSPEETKKAVALIDGRVESESSGGITEETIRSYADCGVDYVSVGAVTHKFRSLDLSLKADFDVAKV
jgi:nicotinate-nucleotide pyrophosphorylase (carboxylating)